nr:sigma-70 family RNA polymerase sigma factor [uncultured Cupriavidus sp.]
MTPEDAEKILVSQAAAGNQHAFGQLVERHGAALAQAARSFGIPETDIDDVVQETFVSAWHGLDDFDRERSFRAWLFSIAMNKMRDLYRFRRVRHFLFGAQDLQDPEVADTVPDEDPGPERRVAARRRLASVVAVLTKLDARGREAIVLTSIVGMSSSEAAASLGITVKALEGRVTRARAKLAALL